MKRKIKYPIEELLKPLGEKKWQGNVYGARFDGQIIMNVEKEVGPSPSPSPTPSVTPSISITPTPSVTPSISVSPSVTPSVTPSITPTPSSTPPPPFQPFIFEVDTNNAGSSSNTQFTLGCNGSGYNFDVDWGDGVVENYTGTPGNITHTYPSSGIYQIEIINTFPRFRANNGGDATKIIDVIQFGDIAWDSFELMFDNGQNIAWTGTTDTPILTGVTNMNAAFRDNFDMITIYNLNTWDVSNVTNMEQTFRGCVSFNQDIGNWDVSSVNNVFLMFRDAFNFNNGGSPSISGWTLSSSLTDMTSIFSNAFSFNQPINSWNVSNVTAMGGLFGGASSFNQPLNNWNVSGVTTMESMFSGAAAFNQDIGSWDVSSVTNTKQMFNNATAFNQNIGAWDVSNVTTALLMFNNATSFNNGGSPSISGWTVSGLVGDGIAGMFASATSFNQPIDSWDVSNASIFNTLFFGASSFNQPLNSWNLSNATSIENVFQNATSFNQDLSNWDVSNVTNMRRTFKGASAFNQDIGSWDVGSVTIMEETFWDATAFNNGGSSSISGWTTSNVTNMTVLFANSSFNQPIDSWNVSSVTNMSFMFYGTSAFNQPLNNWNVSGVTTMESMFQNATAFNQDIGAWDLRTAGVNMTSMLNGSGLSCDNYSKTLIGWANYVDANSDTPANVTLGASTLEYNNTNFGGSPYDNGVDARAYLVGSPVSWTITDAGTC